MLPLKLYLNELRAPLHLAFEDDAFAKYIVAYFITRFEFPTINRGTTVWLDGFRRGCL